MMLREMNRRTLLSLVALVILVILSAATLDYSGLLWIKHLLSFHGNGRFERVRSA